MADTISPDVCAADLGARSLDWHDGKEPMVAIPARVLTDAIHELDWLLMISARTAGDTHTGPATNSGLRIAALLEAMRRHDGTQFRLSDETADLITEAHREFC